MRIVPDQVAVTTFDKHHPGATTIATKTISAVSDQIHVLLWIAWSFSAASAAAESITVSFGGTDVFVLDIAATGSGRTEFIDFRSGEYGGLHNNTKNEDMVITLTAPSTGSGKINFAYR